MGKPKVGLLDFLNLNSPQNKIRKEPFTNYILYYIEKSCFIDSECIFMTIEYTNGSTMITC